MLEEELQQKANKILRFIIKTIFAYMLVKCLFCYIILFRHATHGPRLSMIELNKQLYAIKINIKLYLTLTDKKINLLIKIN